TFKVPHHGSENAHFDDVWTNCLEKDAWTLLTPYSRGKSPLPKPSDVKRLKSLSTRVYCTASPGGKRPDRRRGVESTIREVAKTRRAIPRQPGHIRLRLPINGDFRTAKVTLQSGALAL